MHEHTHATHAHHTHTPHSLHYKTYNHTQNHRKMEPHSNCINYLKHGTTGFHSNFIHNLKDSTEQNVFSKRKQQEQMQLAVNIRTPTSTRWVRQRQGRGVHNIELTAVNNVLVEPATAIRGATVAMFNLLLVILVIDLPYIIIIMVGQLL